MLIGLFASHIKSFYSKYESHIGVLAIILGFISDNLTLRNTSIYTQTIVFSIYLLLVGVSICVLHFIEGKKSKEDYKKTHFWFFLLMQFTFGSLFSMFFVFYSRGVSISTSWPFLLILIINMISTEFFKKYYTRLSLQISMFFIAVFSFSIYFLPIVIHKMNQIIFLLSGIMALVIIIAFIKILESISFNRVQELRKRIIIGVSVVFFIINILYFTNLIPPVPLVMKEGVLSHSLRLNEERDYVVMQEKKSLVDFLNPYPEYHRQFFEPVYFVTSVYAPSKLETDVIHNWQYYDELSKKWISSTKIKVLVIGGRENGYRMYSFKQNTFIGKWRIDVETSNGQIIGRVRFKIIDGVAVIEEKTI